MPRLARRIARIDTPVGTHLGTCIALVAAALLAVAAAPVKNGFDLEGAEVPPDEIREGGPARDGIRSVDAPAWVAPGEADEWVAPANPVIGVAAGGEARTVPLHLIEYHQVVNATLGGEPVAITYDPLTGVPRAFRRQLGDRTLELGVSGLVYNGSFLLYDRETESLFVQFTGQGIAGPLAGERLERLRVRLEPLAVWLSRQPEASVMTRPAPKRIDYRYSPFSSYIASERVPFPVKARDDRIHPKTLVLGVEADGAVRAYPSSAVMEAGGRARDEVAGHTVEMVYDVENAVFSWEAPGEVRVTEGFWFAWKAFHPETGVWSPPAGEPAGAEEPGAPEAGAEPGEGTQGAGEADAPPSAQ